MHFKTSSKKPVAENVTIPWLFSAICTILLICSGLYALNTGSIEAGLGDVISAFVENDFSPMGAFVVWELRIPRLLAAFLVGAAFGGAGCVTQAITRNPLGDPSLIGVTTGAAFFVVLAYTYLTTYLPNIIVIGVAGGVFGASITFALARQTNFSPMHMVLAGMAVSLFFSAATVTINIIDSSTSNSTYFWLIGNLANRSWVEVNAVGFAIILGLAALLVLRNKLNILMFDDDNARSRGMNVRLWRLVLGMIAVGLVACCVAIVGPIGFIGLIAPHIVRMVLHSTPFQTDHRIILPLSILAGATILMVTDAIALSGYLGPNLPTGILCSLIGGITFAILFRNGVV